MPGRVIMTARNGAPLIVWQSVQLQMVVVSGSCLRTSPIPVGAGFVESLARPGGNVTGFMGFEYGMSGSKWLELLKEVARGVTRVAVLRDPALPAGLGQLGAIPGGGSVAQDRGERG